MPPARRGWRCVLEENAMNDKELLKQYLNRYNKAKNRIKELEALQKQLRGDAGYLQSTGDSVSVKIQSNSVSGGAAAVALRIVEIDERISDQREQLSTLLGEILDIFDYLPLESDERAVLELRYIQNMREKCICKTRFISRSKYYSLCDSAIETLLKYQRITNILRRYGEELARFR